MIHGKVANLIFVIARTSLFGAAAANLAACTSSEDDVAGGHDQRTVPSFIGEHTYACENGARYDADFLKDGLTLELTEVPGGRRMRLVAGATGDNFVGQGVTVRLAQGDRMSIANGGRLIRCQQVRERRTQVISPSEKYGRSIYLG